MPWIKRDNAGTKHKENCQRIFGRLDPTCDRCKELANGAKPRKAWGWNKAESERKAIAAIRQHDCKISGCGHICTFGEW